MGSLITLSQEVLASLTLVLLAALIFRWQSLDLEKQMLVAVVRAIIQLTLICFALTYIFDVDSTLMILLILSVMTMIVGYTSGGRAADPYPKTALQSGMMPIVDSTKFEDFPEKIEYKAVVNHEEQYSLWPAGHESPRGWKEVGRTGSKRACLAYIEEVWTDMRPLSIHTQMAADIRRLR